ncbi:MAG: VCBS repeat-containing protein [Candidatus Hydrogenedentes bacterium]|nr:VCBS repeat-containing protein [Candidatus Hydrogenedentota bacterium]
MITAFWFITFGAIAFIEQELPKDVAVIAFQVGHLSGQDRPSFRTQDMDSDGMTDLVCETGVAFQRNGRFPKDAVLTYPQRLWPSRCDVWGGRLYSRGNGRLEVLTVSGGQWETVLEQDVQWPDERKRSPDETTGQRRPVPNIFVQSWFLCDIDGDNVPEIVVPAEDGLRVYVQIDGQYRANATLNVYPPLKGVRTTIGLLWPEVARRIVIPVQEMDANVVLDRNELTVLEEESVSKSQQRLISTRYALRKNRDGIVEVGPPERTTSEPLPASMQVIRLNDDDVLDYAGVDWERSTSSPLPRPICETWASTDGGKTLQVRRSVWSRPEGSFVDADGDGDLDMVTETTGLFDGGVRETISRLVTAREISHEIRIYLLDAQGHYAETPQISGQFIIQLDKPPAFHTRMFRQYLTGDLIDLTGDFNNDGFRDAVVRTRPDRLEVFLGTATGFRPETDFPLPFRDDLNFGVADVDGDSRSDITVARFDLEAEPPAGYCYVYLNRERK